VRVVFLIACAGGLVFFLVSRRRFDLFSLAFFSSCFYFVPGLAGFVQMPTRDSGLPVETPVSDPTYAVMTLVLAGVCVAGALLGQPPSPSPRPGPNGSGGLLTVQWLAAAGALVALVALFLDPRTVWSVDKVEVLESLGRVHIVMTTFAAIAAVAAVKTRRFAPLMLALPALAADLVLGFRLTVVLAVIATFLVVLNGRSVREVVRCWGLRLLAAAAVPVVIFVSWQQLYPVVRAGEWAEARERATFSHTYVEALRNVEPFVTQSILERVVEEKYRVPTEHLLGVLAVAVPLYTEFFPAPLSFNDRFQPDLFPEVQRYGLANNIWAEAWAVGGIPMVAIYVALWSAVLWLGSWCLRSKSEHLVVLGAICGAYAAFYVHRNDVLYQAVLERRFVLGYLAVACLAWLLRHAARREGADRVRPA